MAASGAAAEIRLLEGIAKGSLTLEAFTVQDRRRARLSFRADGARPPACVITRGSGEAIRTLTDL